jgi:hypothetical protein
MSELAAIIVATALPTLALARDARRLCDMLDRLLLLGA